MTAVKASREAPQGADSSAKVAAAAESTVRENRARAQGAATRLHRYASDDEILGIESAATPAHASAASIKSDIDYSDGLASAESAPNGASVADNNSAGPADSAQGTQTDPQIEAAIDAHPELRQAWQDAQSYREAFATPQEARAATALLGDLNRMDALFFSHRPEDHAELAKAVASLDPAAFASLALAMTNLAAAPHQPAASAPANPQPQAPTQAQARDPLTDRTTTASPTPPQVEFLHAANAAAVQGVLDSIETQVDRLLPEGVSKTARNRMVGEIYRELDASLGSNRQLGQQMRDAFRSGNLDAQHQRAVVSLITGRARQALPGIAKRVLNEWTSTVVAANQDRLARQRAAAHRVDIAGSGRGADGGRRSLGPRDIDYNRLSDSDILNL
ncbi:MAG: hypothetical protein ACRD5K_03100 [Candidatus Acidiferrales bacterium]